MADQHAPMADQVQPTERRHFIITLSSGAASWMAGKRKVAEVGAENCTAIFTDVKGYNPSEHAGEDEDNYRFLRQCAADLGVVLVWLVEGRDIHEVFDDQHMLGNSRAPICSQALKQEPSRKWVRAHFPDPTSAVIVLGLDWTEQRRMPGNAAGWAPYEVEYPLMAEPWLDKAQVLDMAREVGMEPPRLYGQGFSHANCGGFCVQMGQADAERLLRQNRPRYLYHEEKEEAFRTKYDKDAAFMVDRSKARVLAHQGLTDADVERDGKWWRVIATGEELPKRTPLTMRQFRLRLDLDPSLFDAEDSGPCACFPFADETPITIGRAS